LFRNIRSRNGLKAGNFDPAINHTYSYADSTPLVADDPYGLSTAIGWGDIGRGVGRSIGGGIIGLIGAGASVAYKICKAANDDPCAHCYEDDKRNTAYCHALASTAGRKGTRAYGNAYRVCMERANEILFACLKECEQ
jgi:hypothetical protein